MKLTLEAFECELDLAMELKTRYYLTDYESIKLAYELKRTRHIESISNELRSDLKETFASTLFDLLNNK